MPIHFNQSPAHDSGDRSGKQPGLVAYLTVGDPDLETTYKIALAAIDAGADVIELGVPFSDPLADGPVIQRASERAVERGVTLSDVLALAKRLRAARPQCGLVLFSYLNPVIKFGHRFDRNQNQDQAFERFCSAAASAGIDGVLLTDMIVEEADEYLAAMTRHHLAPIFLVAPTSPDARLEKIAAATRGFVYVISRVGITGAQKSLESDAEQLVARLRRYTRLPLAVGFGISSAEHVEQVGRFADAAVIGSALVAIIEASSADVAPEAVGRFIGGLRPAPALARS